MITSNRLLLLAKNSSKSIDMEELTNINKELSEIIIDRVYDITIPVDIHRLTDMAHKRCFILLQEAENIAPENHEQALSLINKAIEGLNEAREKLLQKVYQVCSHEQMTAVYQNLIDLHDEKITDEQYDEITETYTWAQNWLALIVLLNRPDNM